MTARAPLVIVAGATKQLPSGDTIPTTALLAGTGTVEVVDGTVVARPVSLGGIDATTGFSSANYVTVAGASPGVVPAFGPGQSLVFLFVPHATPTVTEFLVMHGNSGASTGWHVRIGDSVDRHLCRLYLKGLASDALIDLTGATFSGALNAAHCLAVAILADKSVHFAWDGVLQTALGIQAGTYVSPDAADPFRIGASATPDAAATSVQFRALRTYSTILSDADLVTASAVAAQLPTVTGTLTTDLHAAQFATRRSVIDAADSGRRWGIVGTLDLHQRST